MFASLAAFSALTILTATAQSIEQLAVADRNRDWGEHGVVPLALALVGRLYPYERRGQPARLAVRRDGRGYGHRFAIRCDARSRHWLAKSFHCRRRGRCRTSACPFAVSLLHCWLRSVGNWNASGSATQTCLAAHAASARTVMSSSIRCFTLGYLPGSACTSSRNTTWGPSASDWHFLVMAFLALRSGR